MIELKLSRESKLYSCGETISGSLEWSNLPESTQSLEIRLIWFTRGKGDRDVGIVSRQSIASPAANGHDKFEFRSPDSPYSFSGKLISLIWAVEAIAFPSREAESVEMVIAPQGKEIELTSVVQLARLGNSPVDDQRE